VGAEAQNSKFKIQNAKCKMQNAECETQGDYRISSDSRACGAHGFAGSIIPDRTSMRAFAASWCACPACVALRAQTPAAAGLIPHDARIAGGEIVYERQEP
jgi:hypothetical protein